MIYHNRIFLDKHKFIENLNLNQKTEKMVSIEDHSIPANIYLFKVNNRNTRKRCEIFSKFTIKIPERRHIWWDDRV